MEGPRSHSEETILKHLLFNIRSLYLSSEQLRGFTLLSPTLAIMVLFLALPLGIILIYSFWTKGVDGLEPSFVFASYENFFNHPAYPLLLGKSVLISFCVTIAAVGLAYPSGVG